MALTHTRCKEVAEQAQAIANRAKALHYDIKKLLDTNSDLAIDWAGNPKPAYLNEDAAGNLDGLAFTRAQMANLIGSFDNMRKTLDNEQAAQGDHLGNLNQVADSDA